MYTFVQPRGVSIFSPKTQKCHVYFCTTKGGGSRRDPNHKSMYKCAYMYVHLSLSPPPPPPRCGHDLYLELHKGCFDNCHKKHIIQENESLTLLYGMKITINISNKYGVMAGNI